MVIYLKPTHRNRIAAVLSLVLMLLGIRLGASFYRGAGEPVTKMAPLQKVETEEPLLGLMVEIDRAEPQLVSGLLSSMNDLGVAATWFFDVAWIEENAHLVESFKDTGHEIGLRGTDDVHLHKLQESEAEGILLKNKDALQSLGIEPAPFLYPKGGKFSVTLQETAIKKGYQAVKPTKKLFTFLKKPEVWADKTAKSMTFGDILIINVHKNTLKPDLKYLVPLFKAVEAQGLSVVGLSNLTKGIQ